MAALHGRGCSARAGGALPRGSRRAAALALAEQARLRLKDDERTAAAAPEEGGDSAVSVAWRQGMSCVLRSPSRFSRTLGASQPWFVVVEDEARESSPFDSFGRKLPEGASPLYWHFMESCVVLRLSCFGDGGRVWEAELEELLAARRRHAPLRGRRACASPFRAARQKRRGTRYARAEASHARAADNADRERALTPSTSSSKR